MAIKDGTFTGTGKGYKSNLNLEVIIENSSMTEIRILDHKDTKGVVDNAIEKLPQRIIDAQSYNVDAISGATYSSRAIKDGVKNAVQKAGAINEFSQKNESETNSKLEQKQWDSKKYDVDEVIQTSIVIVGGGISGLAAAVQAGLDGVEAILLEKLPETGGNGAGVEGMFAVGSSLQKEKNIEINPADIITAEHDQGQYRSNGALWMDLVHKSADNFQWCLEQGVEFLGEVDNYYTGLYNTFHWFKERHASEGYIKQMTRRAEELGTTIMTETAVKSLIFENRVVKGVIAQSKGKVYQINAEAVILATGGIGGNRELIQKQGWNTENMLLTGMPSSIGDGYEMAQSVGAKDMIHESCQLIMNYVEAFPTDTTPLYIDKLNGIRGLPSGGPVLFVNEEGDRFVNEGILDKNMMLQSMAMRANKANYMIFTKDIFVEFTQSVGIDNGEKILSKTLKENQGDSLYAGKDVSELAKAFNIPEQELICTVQTYNELCVKGTDTDFSKNPKYLIPLEGEELFISRVDQNYLVGIGGVGTNKRYEVINEKFDAIEGLYATGMDGVMLYRNVYTMNMPGTACGFSVNSGRYAVKNAQAYLN